MKSISFSLIALSLIFCFQAGAANSSKAKPAKKSSAYKTCKRLIQQAEDNCVETMCESYQEDSGDQECVHDGDFNEGLQICVYDSELPDLIALYNKKHPGKNLSCDKFL